MTSEKLRNLFVTIATVFFGCYIANILTQFLIVNFTHITEKIDPIAWYLNLVTLPYFGFSLSRFPLIIGIFAGVALLGVQQSAAQRQRLKGFDIDPQLAHGGERWATIAERAPYAHTQVKVKDTKGKSTLWEKPDTCEELLDDNIILSNSTKMALSDNPNRNFKPSNKHIYVMAGSGAGKSFNFLRTNVMQLNGSMVFTDPKGENFKILANFLTKHGYKVRVLSLREEEAMYASNTYNPMKYVHNMTDVSVIIDMFIKNTNSPESSKNGDFFEKAERMLYSALLGYLYFQYGKRGLMSDCTIPNLLDLLIMAQTKDKPKSPLDIIFFGTPEEDGYYGFERRLIDEYDGDRAAAMQGEEWTVITSYEGFKSTAGSPETMASVIVSCFVRLDAFSKAAVRHLFSQDTLELEKLGEEKTAIFIITKDTGSPYDFAAAMLLYQLFDINIALADAQPSGHVKIPILCYLDELANVGKIPNLEKLFATARSRWINLIAIVQDQGQLENVYGKTAQSIISNCATMVYLGASDEKSAEWLSKQMGNTTRAVTEWSRSYSATGGSTSKSTHYIQVPLMSAAEILNVGLDPDECLTKHKQARWLKDKKPDPMQHPRWKELIECGACDIIEWKKEQDRQKLLRNSHEPKHMRKKIFIPQGAAKEEICIIKAAKHLKESA